MKRNSLILQYRTNDVIIECEKVNAQNSNAAEQMVAIPITPLPNSNTINSNINNNVEKTSQSTTTNISQAFPTVTAQTAVIQPEMATSSTNNNNHSNNTFQNVIKPFKRELSYLDSSLQDIIDELPTEIDFEVEAKRPKLFETTVELRETRLNVQLVRSTAEHLVGLIK